MPVINLDTSILSNLLKCYLNMACNITFLYLTELKQIDSHYYETNLSKHRKRIMLYLSNMLKIIKDFK